MSAKKERKLTEAERQRLDAFNATCDRLVSEGYTLNNLNIAMFGAGVASIVVAIVLFVVCLPIFNMMHPDAGFAMSIPELIICLIIFFALIVLHELIHGFTWSRFTPHGFKDIDFGIMLNSLSPYCTCREPLRKGAYITGALMPLIILGIIPTLLSLAVGSTGMLYIGICMIAAEIGRAHV